VNRSLNTMIQCKTFEEVRTYKPVDYSGIQVLGCVTYAHVNEGKLELRAKNYIFLKYAFDVKGYRLWCPDSNGKFLVLRDVKFDE
jgi:hypothetical protein